MAPTISSRTAWWRDGLSGSARVANPPAIANAIFHAVGVRIRKLPIRPEDVLKALREKKTQETQMEEEALATR